MIKKKKQKNNIHITFVTFVLIFTFILIYLLLHVLFVLKTEGIFEKKNPAQKF